jgi:hypothetical protein
VKPNDGSSIVEIHLEIMCNITWKKKEEVRMARIRSDLNFETSSFPDFILKLEH